MEVENKKIVVKEEEVAKLVAEYQSFGWILKDKHEADVGQDGIFVRMVSLEFERAPETPCCTSLRLLNELYDSLSTPPAKKKSKRPEIVLILAGGAALVAVAAMLLLLRDIAPMLMTVLFLSTDLAVAAILIGVTLALLGKQKEKADAADKQKREEIRGKIIVAACAIALPEKCEEEDSAEWETENEEDPTPAL